MTKKRFSGLGAVGRGTPELTHGQVASAIVLEAVEGARVGARGFGHDSEVEFGGKFSEDSVVVFGNAVGNGFAEVGEEGVA